MVVLGGGVFLMSEVPLYQEAEPMYSDFVGLPTHQSSIEGENLHRTYDVRPLTQSVQRGLEMKELRDLKDFDDSRCTTYNPLSCFSTQQKSIEVSFFLAIID